MSIAERLARPLDRIRILEPLDKGGGLSIIDPDSTGQQRTGFLEETGVLDVMSRLVQEIRPKHPNAQLSLVNGVALLSWDLMRFPTGEVLTNNIKVHSIPSRQELVVEGLFGSEILTKSQWEKEDVLEDAIISQYMFPAIGFCKT